MADDAFAFIQAVFHVILFIVVHGHRARRGIKAHRKQTEVHNRNSTNPPQLAPLNRQDRRSIIQTKGNQ
jgi:hypothetical protein